MRAGQLRNVVALQSPGRTADGGGGAAVVWTTYASPYARFDPMPKKDKEELHGEVLRSAVGWLVTLRWHSSLAITAAHRVLYNGKAYQIRIVRNIDELNKTISLECEEGVAV